MLCCYVDELKEGFLPWIDLVNILHYVVSPLGIEHCDELRCWTLISSENWNVFVGRIFLGAWYSSRWWQIDMLIDMVFILLANLLRLFHWAWLLHLWQVAPILMPLLKFYFHEEVCKLSLVSVSLLNVKSHHDKYRFECTCWLLEWVGVQGFEASNIHWVSFGNKFAAEFCMLSVWL